MKIIALVLFAAIIGCEPGPTTTAGQYPADAGDGGSGGESASSSSSSSGMSCTPIVWSFGPDRFCEQCTCADTPCSTRALNEDLVVGVCGEDLSCSAACNDPLWIEMQKP
jgi:hypothetical protein